MVGRLLTYVHSTLHSTLCTALQSPCEIFGTSGVAMIGYVGDESDCTHGVAVALDDENGKAKMELIRGTVPLIIFILHNFCITPNDTPVSLES